MGKISVLSSDYVPVRLKNVLFRKNSDGTVALMRLDDNQFFFTLDGVSAEAWLMMDGTATIGEIQKQLIKKCNPSLDRFEAKVFALVEELQSEGLLKK